MLGALLVSGPACAAFAFFIALVNGWNGPSAVMFVTASSVTALGAILFFKRPLLTDMHIMFVGISGTFAIGGLAYLSPVNAAWSPAFPVLFLVSLTVAHLFLARKTAVALHVFVLFVSVASMQLAHPSIEALFERDFITVTWTTIAGAIVSLVRRRLDRSTALLFVQANRDSLTHLWNRLAFTTTVNAALVETDVRGRPRTPKVSVFLLDLDRFKAVNDTMGHAFGDSFLQRVAERLTAFAEHEDDLAGCSVARLGGDEFAVFVPSSLSTEQRAKIAIDMRAYFHGRFMVDGVHVHCDVSIGSAAFPEDGTTLPDLLAQADRAMYRAKVLRSGVEIEENDGAKSERREQLLRDLDHAIESDGLLLFFQPKVRLRDGSVPSVEALLRWKHPEFGYVSPIEFVALAEGTGLIGALTERVLQMAARQLASWHANGIKVSVAVNISARNLVDRQFGAVLRDVFQREGAELGSLIIEVTETAVMSDVRVAKLVLEELRSFGVHLAIDDFGTGYSSLAYLRDLSVDELKIDQSFIRALAFDGNAVIVKTAIQLAHNLGLIVVAEGVEDAQTLELLRLLRCDFVQGYHLAHPMPADATTTWLCERRSQQQGGLPLHVSMTMLNQTPVASSSNTTGNP